MLKPKNRMKAGFSGGGVVRGMVAMRVCQALMFHLILMMRVPIISKNK